MKYILCVWVFMLTNSIYATELPDHCSEPMALGHDMYLDQISLIISGSERAGVGTLTLKNPVVEEPTIVVLSSSVNLRDYFDDQVLSQSITVTFSLYDMVTYSEVPELTKTITTDPSCSF